MNRFYVRKFLNRRGHHAGAYVLAVVKRTEPTDDPDTVWPYVELEIADCSRRVNLEFPLRSAADRSNSLRKARLLATVLADFADAIEAEADAAAERGRRPTRATPKRHRRFRDAVSDLERE